MHILQVDVRGQPQSWISPERAAGYYATDSVRWHVGEVATTFRGGVNALSGEQSFIEVHPIIALHGASPINMFDAVPSLTNDRLFKRDLYRCSYCDRFHKDGFGLTRDHIIPRVQNGEDKWSNTTSACASCNGYKAGRRPEEAGMVLLRTPYVPSVFEGFLLSRRNIREDVHEWLASRLPKTSRWYPG